MVRKLSFLRRLGIEDAENQFGPIANAERLFAIVGLSMASVCIFNLKILKLRIFKNDRLQQQILANWGRWIKIKKRTDLLFGVTKLSKNNLHSNLSINFIFWFILEITLFGESLEIDVNNKLIKHFCLWPNLNFVSWQDCCHYRAKNSIINTF